MSPRKETREVDQLEKAQREQRTRPRSAQGQLVLSAPEKSPRKRSRRTSCASSDYSKGR